jgi:hypothetical protein
VATIEGRKVPGLDGRTTGSPGYKLSQTIRKRTEQIFGWMKTVGGMRRSRYCGLQRTDAACKWVAAALSPVALGQAEPGHRRPWCGREPAVGAVCPKFGNS